MTVSKEDLQELEKLTVQTIIEKLRAGNAKGFDIQNAIKLIREYKDILSRDNPPYSSDNDCMDSIDYDLPFNVEDEEPSDEIKEFQR